MTGTRKLMVIAGALVAGVGLSGAQQNNPAQPPGSVLPLSQLKRVEQGVGDQGPGSTSLRQAPADLRVPNDFAGVYQIPSTANSPYAGWYARVSGMGGMVAVFPRSTYAPTGRGTFVPTTPPGTQFLIGGIPIGGGGAVGTARASDLAVSSRVDGREPPRPPDEERTWRPAPDRIVATPLNVSETDPRAFGFDWSLLTGRLVSEPGYRAARVAALLDAATRANTR